MTQKQMAAFLRKEGWDESWCKHANKADWPDPMSRNEMGYYHAWYTLEDAYRLARRRKAQREARRLKRAGYYFEYGQWWHGDHTLECHLGDYQQALTKAEALATLGGPHAQ
jgi:hypothetical protein